MLLLQLCNYATVKHIAEYNLGLKCLWGYTTRGCHTMSHVRFNIVFESVICGMFNREIWQLYIGLLIAYVNDIIIIGNTQEEIQTNLKNLLKVRKIKS